VRAARRVPGAPNSATPRSAGVRLGSPRGDDPRGARLVRETPGPRSCLPVRPVIDDDNGRSGGRQPPCRPDDLRGARPPPCRPTLRGPLSSSGR
jgi:hypothetical protein